MNVAQILETGSYSIAFQPIVRLTDRRIMGYEALARFSDGSRPDDRFAEAAGAGLGVTLQLATMAAAVADARALPAGALFLNASASLLAAAGPEVSQILSGHTSAKRELVIELFEGEAIADTKTAIGLVERFCRGAGIALDDVGAGFAGVERVVAFAPSFVKLDRALIRGMTAGGSRRAEGDQILMAAASVRSAVIAEGLEEEADILRVMALGVGFGQGWVLGRPAPAATWS